MKGLNKVVIMGNLGKDPESRFLPDGTQTVNLTVATSKQWKDKSTGEQKERTEWHRLVAFGRTAEIIAQYMRKGSRGYFEGELQTRKWQDSTGQDKYTTEIRVHEMQFLDKKDDGDNVQQAAKQPTSQNRTQQPPEPPPMEQGDPGFDDDIPF